MSMQIADLISNLTKYVNLSGYIGFYIFRYANECGGATKKNNYTIIIIYLFIAFIIYQDWPTLVILYTELVYTILFFY